MIPYSKMTGELKKVSLLIIDDYESFYDVRDAEFRNLLDSLVDDEASLPNFECSFDDERLYEFQWLDRGLACFATFVKPNEISSLIKESKEYANEIGFDPLSPGDMEVRTKVYVYSPNSFPTKELKSLQAKDADIVLVTTPNIVDKFQLNKFQLDKM